MCPFLVTLWHFIAIGKPNGSLVITRLVCKRHWTVLIVLNSVSLDGSMWVCMSVEDVVYDAFLFHLFNIAR